jgi:lipopolysaccharide biosynthesis regulator YciM
MDDLPPVLLLLAFVAVGGAAWLLGRRSGAARTVRLPRDYFVGLDHLINDRFDRATEVFARMSAVDGDVEEIQIALGSLFRRRGETDRAIALHERLRAGAGGALRDRATFELARDYLSAGLMDRAEQLFRELAASSEHRRAALDQLVRVQEQQGDWAAALSTLGELPADVRSERRREAAHFLCELAEQALAAGEVERARSFVSQARDRDAGLGRIAVLEARIHEAAGDRRAALAQYIRAVEISPELSIEIVPKALEAAHALGEHDVLDRLVETLRRNGRLNERQIAWLLATATPGEGESASTTLMQLLRRMGDSGGRYSCEDCGLQGSTWYWRCPRCRGWDTLRPAVLKWSATHNST